jgi:hypothetical protein
MRQIQLFIKHDSAKIINLAYFCRLYLRILTFGEIVFTQRREMDLINFTK